MDSTEPLLRDQSSSAQPNVASPRPQSADKGMHRNGMTLRVYGQLFGSALSFYISGLEMSAIGILLPKFETRYGISDSRAASVFIAAVSGYVVATLATDSISVRYGYRGIALLAPAIRVLCTLVLFTDPPFTLLLSGLFLFGIGTGISDVGWNTWASQLSRANIAQGLLHGSFAAGAVSGPVITTALIESVDWTWLFTLVAALSVTELLVQGWAFRLAGPVWTENLDGPLDPDDKDSLFKSRAAWLCCGFGLAYNSAEASLTNWIVVYMRRHLSANVSQAAAASSIFWLGMAVGRVVLGPVTEYLGLRGSVTAYITASIVSQVLLALSRSIVGTHVVLCVNGFFYGPLFPSAVTLLSRRVPEHQRIKGIAAIIALAQVGAAAGPALVGILAQTVGIFHLTSLILGLSIVTFFIWRAT